MLMESHSSVAEQDRIFIKPYAESADSAGFRVAIKDTFDRKGEVTACGSKALAHVPAATENADVVEALEKSDSALVGRVNMHELAYGVTGVNHWNGTPVNPFYPDLIPGGSSSGSAASVAAGLADVALGTDTGGSVRVPAACCGVVGLKPSFGRVSRRGVSPANSSLDCVGPFARNVTAIEAAMEIIDPSWQTEPPAPFGKVGFFATSGDAQVQSKVCEIARTEFDLVPVELPLFSEAMDAGLKIIGRESWSAFGHLIKTGKLGRDVAERLEAASKISDDEIRAAEETRAEFRNLVDLALSRVDALVLPTVPIAIPRLVDAGDARAIIPITANCRPFNLSGHPAISIPIGELNGAPVSMQLVGKMGEDEKLCALAGQVPVFIKGEQQ